MIGIFRRVRANEVCEGEIALLIKVVRSGRKEIIEHYFIECKQSILCRLSGSKDADMAGIVTEDDTREAILIMSQQTEEGIACRSRNDALVRRQNVIMPTI